MTLPTLPEEKIRAIVEEIQDGFRVPQASVILTSGEVLYGDVKFSWNDEDLFMVSTSSRWCGIPIDRIADITAIHSKKIEGGKDGYLFGEFPSEKNHEQRNVSIAEQYDFTIGKVRTAFQLGGAPVDRTSITFQQDTPLYCDWEHFSRIGDGRSLDSLGGSALGFGLSIGWSEEEDQWETFEDLITDIKNIKDISEQNRSTISGHVNFVVHNEDIVTESMEGDDWYLSVVTPQKVMDTSELKSTDWMFCYFRRGYDHFPMEEWEKIKQKINIYGDLIHTSITQPFGESEFFMKGRAVGYVDGDSS